LRASSTAREASTFPSVDREGDLAVFRRITDLVQSGRHKTVDGVIEILAWRGPMNRGGKRRRTDDEIVGLSRAWESSEAIRKAPPRKPVDEDMVHAPWRHGGYMNYNGQLLEAVAKPGCMLEHPSIRRYSSVCLSPTFLGGRTGSENPSGADNQQETAIAGSSETVRQASSSTHRCGVKIQSDPHGDMGSQAEMT
jgi:hypothetical protein